MNSGGGKRRVVITGVGPITSIGSGPGDFWNAVLDGRSGGRRLEFQWFDRHHSYKCRVGAPVDEPDPAKFDIGPREADLLDPASRYALMAASMALHDGGLETVQVSDTRGPVYHDRFSGRQDHLGRWFSPDARDR